MRAIRSTLLIGLLCVPLHLPLNAQEAAVSRFRLSPPIDDPLPRSIEPSDESQERRAQRSTLSERFAGGFILGGFAALATAQLTDSDRAPLAALALGSASGVLLATAAREKPRTLAVLIGTAFGAIPILALDLGEENPFAAAFILTGSITMPLLGAVGHSF